MNLTKGEWTVQLAQDYDEHEFEISYDTPDGLTYPIADIHGRLEYGDAEANARLIVAAVNACQKVNPENPLAVAGSIQEMYEALKKCADFLYSYSGDGLRVSDRWYSKFKERYQLAYDVLAKAEGKE